LYLIGGTYYTPEQPAVIGLTVFLERQGIESHFREYKMLIDLDKWLRRHSNTVFE